jgi:hypothetical protein
MNEATKILAFHKLSRHLKSTGTRSGVAGTYNRSELMDQRKGARTLGDAHRGAINRATQQGHETVRPANLGSSVVFSRASIISASAFAVG